MVTSGNSDVDPHAALILMEDDILGTSLKEPFESRAVAELGWCLLCRGISSPTTWKKAQVVKK